MRRGTNSPGRGAGPTTSAGARPRAFTLIEMLAVLMILSILVALAVGVGNYVMDKAKRQKTLDTQRVVMRAIDEYFTVVGGFPGDSADCSGLLTALQENPKTAQIIHRLPSSAISDGKIIDGYGNAMQYLANDGLGNRPLLESAGKDGDMGMTEDNVRSDGR